MVDPAVVDQVLQRGRIVPWIGQVWRIHEAIWDADDPGGSLIASGRWNRGRDIASINDAFPVLYTSTAPGVADWELIRHSWRPDADEMWRRFARVRRTWMDIGLPSALDLRDPRTVGLQTSDLLDDGVNAHLLPQAISAEAYRRGLSGLLVPTATAMGRSAGDYNVIVFCDLTGATKLVYGLTLPATIPRQGVGIEIRGHEQPNLSAH